MNRGRSRFGRSPEPLDQPRPEQSDRRVTQRLRMRDEVVTETVIQGRIEGLDQVPRANLVGEQVSIAKRDSLATQSVLRCEQLRVEHQAALVVDRRHPVLAYELRPGMMPRQIRNSHVNNLVGLDEIGEILARMLRRNTRMTQNGLPSRP